MKIVELIIDEDFLFALENLKKMGTTMSNANKEKDKETSEGISKSLFTSLQPNENDNKQLASLLGSPGIKKEPDQNLMSPRPRLFDGLKCLSADPFVDSAKKSKPRTPSQSNVGSPLTQNQSSLDLYKA